MVIIKTHGVQQTQGKSRVCGTTVVQRLYSRPLVLSLPGHVCPSPRAYVKVLVAAGGLAGAGASFLPPSVEDCVCD